MDFTKEKTSEFANVVSAGSSESRQNSPTESNFRGGGSEKICINCNINSVPQTENNENRCNSCIEGAKTSTLTEFAEDYEKKIGDADATNLDTTDTEVKNDGYYLPRESKGISFVKKSGLDENYNLSFCPPTTNKEGAEGGTITEETGREESLDFLPAKKFLNLYTKDPVSSSVSDAGYDDAREGLVEDNVEEDIPPLLLEMNEKVTIICDNILGYLEELKKQSERGNNVDEEIIKSFCTKIDDFFEKNKQNKLKIIDTLKKATDLTVKVAEMQKTIISNSNPTTTENITIILENQRKEYETKLDKAIQAIPAPNITNTASLGKAIYILLSFLVVFDLGFLLFTIYKRLTKKGKLSEE